MERASAAGHEVVALGRPELDLCGDDSHILSALAKTMPDVILSAAAFTAVDEAEREPERAFRVNAAGARSVARAARQLRVPLIHLSTDYVFDGAKMTPYTEED